MNACNVVAQQYSTAMVVCVLDGFINEGVGITFPGESLVDPETILEQPDVFDCAAEPNVRSTRLLADFVIKDWHSYQAEEWSGPDEHRDEYRCVLEQSAATKQVYFQLYSSALDSLSTDVSRNGLCGVIEIRNGKPAISLGLDEHALSVHIDSDIANGLYVRHDSAVTTEKKGFYSFDHEMLFGATYYACSKGSWLQQARDALAEACFAGHTFESAVEASDGWQISGNTYLRNVYLENPLGGDSVKTQFEVIFGDASTVICRVSCAA
ncbi:MAG: hypothetical protein C9356_11835 [Oleiphilus sp.]|nr:MAG: hypothetical protein C9356_11835 [Oleiphilus sp.]